MSATGRGSARTKLDFYSTPDWATDAILDVILPPGGSWTRNPPRILEPAAGDGAIVRRLLARGVPATHIEACEIDRRRATACERAGITTIRGDFLKTNAFGSQWHELVITNPPYRLAEAFAQTALELVRPGGWVAMLLRLNWLEGQKRTEFHRANRASVYVLPRRPAFGGRKGTDACGYGWFVWGQDHGADKRGRLEFLDVPPARRSRKEVAVRKAA